MDQRPEVRIWMARGAIFGAGERCGVCGLHAPIYYNKACKPCAPNPCDGIERKPINTQTHQRAWEWGSFAYGAISFFVVEKKHRRKGTRRVRIVTRNLFLSVPLPDEKWSLANAHR